MSTGFSIRPYYKELLRLANKHYEVAIFTAGYQWYADPIIDYLDPTEELIQHRYYRHHATYIESEDIFVKDLRIFEDAVKLENIVIVDNYIHSFAFHLQNGIPIVPFYGEQDDQEFLKLIKYLIFLQGHESLQIANENVFFLQKLNCFQVSKFIKHYDIEELQKLEDE